MVLHWSFLTNLYQIFSIEMHSTALPFLKKDLTLQRKKYHYSLSCIFFTLDFAWLEHVGQVLYFVTNHPEGFLSAFGNCIVTRCCEVCRRIPWLSENNYHTRTNHNYSLCAAGDYVYLIQSRNLLSVYKLIGYHHQFDINKNKGVFF